MVTSCDWALLWWETCERLWCRLVGDGARQMSGVQIVRSLAKHPTRDVVRAHHGARVVNVLIFFDDNFQKFFPAWVGERLGVCNVRSSTPVSSARPSSRSQARPPTHTPPQPQPTHNRD